MHIPPQKKVLAGTRASSSAYTRLSSRSRADAWQRMARWRRSWAHRAAPARLDTRCTRTPDRASSHAIASCLPMGHICEGFAFGGAEAQRELLEAEGVAFKDDTHVDMKRSRWQAGL